VLRAIQYFFYTIVFTIFGVIYSMVGELGPTVPVRKAPHDAHVLHPANTCCIQLYVAGYEKAMAGAGTRSCLHGGLGLSLKYTHLVPLCVQEDHNLGLSDYWESGGRARYHLISGAYLWLQVGGSSP
jgi:hypothetical protein